MSQDLVIAYWHDVGRPSPEEMQDLVDEAAGQIGVPYLAVFGQRLPDEGRAYLRDRLPTLQLEEWPDRGHMVHLTESERFAYRLATFVDSMM